jgi:hypothetical protein
VPAASAAAELDIKRALRRLQQAERMRVMPATVRVSTLLGACILTRLQHDLYRWLSQDDDLRMDDVDSSLPIERQVASVLR